MRTAKAGVAVTGLVLAAVSSCRQLPKDRIYLDLAQTPPTVRAAVGMEYNPADVRSIARYVRHGQNVFRVEFSTAGARPWWVELNPAGDQIASGGGGISSGG